MTSEYNELDSTTWGSPPEKLLSDASCLLWDFDGPLCRLFAGHPASGIVVTLCNLLNDLGLPSQAAKWVGTGDPLQILRSEHVAEVVTFLERRMTEEEIKAAAKAEPTDGAAHFVREMDNRGRMLAITSNNSPEAVMAHLVTQELDDVFRGHIYGRDSDDPQLMKPDPDCLERAMAALGVTPRECLMIGDSPVDAEAARRAGVPFLGYARSQERVARLRVGAKVANGVIGMSPLIEALENVRPIPRPHRQGEGG